MDNSRINEELKRNEKEFQKLSDHIVELHRKHTLAVRKVKDKSKEQERAARDLEKINSELAILQSTETSLAQELSKDNSEAAKYKHEVEKLQNDLRTTVEDFKKGR